MFLIKHATAIESCRFVICFYISWLLEIGILIRPCVFASIVLKIFSIALPLLSVNYFGYKICSIIAMIWDLSNFEILCIYFPMGSFSRILLCEEDVGSIFSPSKTVPRILYIILWTLLWSRSLTNNADDLLGLLRIRNFWITSRPPSWLWSWHLNLFLLLWCFIKHTTR